MSTRQKLLLNAAVGLLPAILVAQVQPQNLPQGRAPPPGVGAGQGAGQGRGGGGAYPQRTVDPAMAEQGKALYSVNCAFCHGADTRGGDSGPSLLRSQLVQEDQNGELVAQVVQNGRPPGMPKFDMTATQIADIAAFLHSFVINGRDPARVRPERILTGDAVAGQIYFMAKCASCHSATGDLKGLATKFPDPRTLQQWWLMPGGGGRGGGGRGAAPADNVRGTPATIPLPTGQSFEDALA